VSTSSSVAGFVWLTRPRIERGSDAMNTRSALVTNDTQRVQTPAISRAPSVSSTHGKTRASHSTAPRGSVRWEPMAIARKKE